MAERKFKIHFKMAPGDVSMLTALVRDLKLTYGDRYAVDVATNFPALWRHNPYLTPMRDGDPGVELLYLGKNKDMAESIRESNRNHRHFVTYFHEEFHKRTRIYVPCLYPKPDLHLTDEEKSNPLISGRYWIIVPGGKLDMTNKIWSQVRYQEVVNKLRPWGLQFVQEGATKKLCVHPPLDGVLNMVGQTSIRDLLVNIYHAEGVICGVTFQMHVAAAFDRPCVVLGGGRENPWWEAYVDDWKAFGDKAGPVVRPHRYLHTIGLLKCCQANGCWKQRVVRLHDRTKHDNSLCQLPTSAEKSQIIPKCLDLITSDHVVEAAMSYYEDGTLKPIGKTTGKYNVPPRAVEQTSLLVNSQTAEDLQKFGAVGGAGGIINLFEQPAAPAGGISPKPEPAPPVNSETTFGDVWTPTPQIIQQPELVKTGQARPERGQSHSYPLAMQPEQPKPHTPQPQQHPGAGLYDIMDDPKIGGKVTICVLLYGDEYENLHRRCLNSIVSTVPPSRMDLRVALNQPGPGTQSYVKTLPVTKTYIDYRNRRKYPAMRQMFWDAEDPIQTKWVLWFDDDSYARHPKWLRAAVECILAQPDSANVGMLGQKMRHPLQVQPAKKDPRQWFKGAPWWRNRDFRNKRGQPAPNGDQIHFVVGGFWAISMAAIKTCDIPCPRLNHNGGDVCIGEQLYQGGFAMKQFNDDKKFVHTSAAPRRGFHERFPWY